MPGTSTAWTDLLNQLNKDISQESPKDVLQWGADWFQSKLKQERVSNSQQQGADGGKRSSPPTLGSLPPPSQQVLAPHALSPFSETGPSGSPFGAAGAGNAKSNSPFQPSFGNAFGGSGGAASGPPREPSPFGPDEAGPTDSNAQSQSQSLSSGGGMFGNASPFGQPSSAHHDEDEPPIPSYALGRRTSVSAESLVPQNQRALAPNLESTLEEDEEGAGAGAGGSRSGANDQIPSFPKTPEQLNRIKTAIKPNFLFRNLDEEQEADVLAAMKEVSIGAGEMIIEQGAAGDYFYVVEKGTLEVFVKKEGQVIDPEKGDRPLLGKKVATCVEGNSFGELALMHNAPRAASILSTSPCTLWALDRVSFRTILLDHTSRKRRLYESFLSEVPILASLQPQERAKIADVLESRTFTQGQDVIREGEAGDEFYLIEAGTAVAVKNQDGKEVVVKQYKKGDYFGELALLNKQTRAATVRATGSEPLRVAALGEQAFTRLLGPAKNIMARNVGELYGFAVGR